ncbi:MAG: exodeoxyribonuclease VII small subunit [Candidatus Saccharimonadales bacterium]|nr:exodeoxyribonuclease VII small subunit [Candidatus Saccharimonadales bacterium]
MSSKKAKEFNYGNTMKALEDLLEQIDSDELDVDAAISKFEEGMKLVKQLEDYLNKAENRIETIKKKFS